MRASPLIGSGPDLYLTRPGLGEAEVDRLRRDFAVWSTRRAQTSTAVTLVTFTGVAAVVGLSLLMLGTVGWVAGVTAAVAASITAALARGEVRRAWVWDPGADVVTMSVADRVLGAKLAGAVEAGRRHEVLWYLCSARQDLSAAERAYEAPVVRGDRTAQELLHEEREMARLRLHNVQTRVRQMAVNPAVLR